MRYFRSVAALLIALCVLLLGTVTAAADGLTYEIIGDTDGDGSVNIIDATSIQRWLAELKELSAPAVLMGDVNMDGTTDILDATRIQRWLAELDTQSYIGENYSVVLRRLQWQDIEYQLAHYQTTKGVDISSHNHDVDMNVLRNAGYTFVMIRLGYGEDDPDQDDEWFERNVEKAEAAGLDWGAYLYSYALTVEGAKSEVQHTLRLLEGKYPTMPIAFDMEDDDYKYSKGMPSDQTLHDICVTYLDGISEAGYYPILYSGCSWFEGALHADDLTGKYDLWLAQWYTEMDYTENVYMWQYGGETNYIESPYIEGLSGMFDKNYCFRNYPLIITYYGYNNHTPSASGGQAPVSSSPYHGGTDAGGAKLPEGYDGVMGDSLRERKYRAAYVKWTVG